MAAVVLGKRSRSNLASKDYDSIASRTKRRITLNEPNDENENPFITRNRSTSPQHEDSISVIAPRSTRKTPSSLTRPAKHGGIESRVSVSPVKPSPRSARSAVPVDVYADASDEYAISPQTPRHRDTAAKKIPITPRHRVLVSTQGTPRSARTPSTPSGAALPIYNRARQLFSRSSDPGALVGRDAERAELSQFIAERAQTEAAGCLYISGPPGTGKSALVNEVISQHPHPGTLKTSVVNCMSVRNTKDLSQKLSDDLDLTAGSGFEYLKKCFVQGTDDGSKFVVILDEVDRLVDLDVELLYSLFEWSLLPASHLILIGIANALDLTDRFLPRLKSRNLKPELLPFMPYSAPQIANVLTMKLRSLCDEQSQAIPFLHPAAIQFCAKKVASQTGDLRKAFDICLSAITLVERETRENLAKAALQNSPSKTPLMDNINLSSPPIVCHAHEKDRLGITRPVYTLDTAPKATIAHMARATAQAFSNGATQRLAGLNLQQKAVLCALGALEKHQRDEINVQQQHRTVFATPSKKTSRSNHPAASAPTVKQLFEAYAALCKREHLFHPLSHMEFRDVVAGLETLSLVVPVQGKSGSFASAATPMTPSRTPSRKSGGFTSASGAVTDDRRLASAVPAKELSATLLSGPGAELLQQILHGQVVL